MIPSTTFGVMNGSARPYTSDTRADLSRPAAGSSVPGLAGRPAESIVEAMKAFKDGKREATVMHQIAKGYGDAEIAALAAYFAAQSQ